MSFFQRLCPAPFPPVSSSFPQPHPGPRCCLYNLLEGQPENSWPLGGKYCTISNPSRYSGLHLPGFLQHVQHQHLSVNPLGGRQAHMPARSPSVGLCSKATGLPGITFATLGVSPAGHLGPDPYDTSPTVTNMPQDQISTPLLWNSWSVASFNLFLSQLLTPTARILPPCRQHCSNKPIIKMLLMPLTGPDNPLLCHYFCYYLKWVSDNEMFTIGNTLSCPYGGLGEEISDSHSLRE